MMGAVEPNADATLEGVRLAEPSETHALQKIPPSPTHAHSAGVAPRTAGWGRVRHLLPRIVLRLGLPVALFGHFYSFLYLNPLNAPRMLVGDDWTTYIVSPNFLRTAPLLSIPIAKVPGYIAPGGTTLARTDSIPALAPVYRLLNAMFPTRPVQLVGLLLLIAVVATFNAVARFCDHVRSELRGPQREILTLALATVAVVAPFWNLQYVHPALMQHWILVWALIGALRRCPSFLDGRFAPSPGRWTGLGPICAAAAVQPYLIPMVAIPALAPDLAHLAKRPGAIVRKFGAAFVLVIAISVMLGYIGHGHLGGTGFGAYASDLASIIDPGSRSRFVLDVPSLPDAIGGYGWLGLGGLLVTAAGVVSVLRTSQSRRYRRVAGLEEPSTLESRRPAQVLYLAIGLVAVYALLPVVRLFGRPIIDVVGLTKHFSALTSLFRVNGRFIWSLLWLGLLTGAGRLLTTSRRRTAAVIGLAALVLQLVDVIPWPVLLRPTTSIEYGAASAILRHQRATGARSIQFEPAVVIPGCYPAAYGTFADLGDVLLAASVVGLPVNSGYTARLDPEHVAQNCVAEADAFARGDFTSDVLYVLPRAAPLPPTLDCEAITSKLTACREKGS